METIKRRMDHTWRLFLIANGVYLLWKLLMLWTDQSLTLAAVGELFTWKTLGSWLVLNQSPFMGHLWYLGALLYCYLFYAWLVKGNREESVYWLIPLALAGNLILGEGLSVLGRPVSFLLVRNFWLTGLPFFLWGHWFAKKEAQGGLQVPTWYCVAGIALGAVLSMGEMLVSGGVELYVGSILIVSGLFLLALGNPNWGKGWLLTRIGERDSLHIYLWQMIVLDVLMMLADAGGFRQHILYRWLMPLLVCLLSWLLAEVLEIKKRKFGRS